MESFISEKAKIGNNVKIGKFCVIEDDVIIEDNVEIKNRVTIKSGSHIKENTVIYDGAIIGEDPQHLKDKGINTRVIIGKNCIIREYVTIHRGTNLDKGLTLIEDNVMLMAYAHIAHDAKVGEGSILANNVTLGGHVEIGRFVFVGGLCAIHQHCKVGDYAMVGGLSGVSLDIPPFVKASGQHAKLYGVNTIGLERRGFSKEEIRVIKKAYKIIFRSNYLKKDAIEFLKKEFGENKHIKTLIDFILSSKRGVARDA